MGLLSMVNFISDAISMSSLGKLLDQGYTITKIEIAETISILS